MIDTICALSTPAGKSALALVRISGPRARQILADLGSYQPELRRPEYAILKNRSGELLDEVIATYFQSPSSYTGEDLVEICCHGNPKIVESLLLEIVSRETRIAEPGEFTRRALANAKLTTDQVESLDWVLNSSSIRGVRRGLTSKLAGLVHAVERIEADFLDLIADCQAKLDFSEEEVGAVEHAQVLGKLEKLETALTDWSQAFTRHKHLLTGWTIVLVGPPNSGKSSLFNRLCGFDRSIVFDQPGTTRDTIEHSLEIDGVPLVLIDSAGIRQTDDPIEQLGIAKSIKAIEASNCICWITDNAEPPPHLLRHQFSDQKWVLASSKADLGGPTLPESFSFSAKPGFGDGVKRLLKALLPDEEPEGLGHGDWAPLTSARQQQKVERAASLLKEAQNLLRSGEYLDWITQKILEAKGELDEIVARIDNEEVLKTIFGRFCIGK